MVTTSRFIVATAMAALCAACSTPEAAPKRITQERSKANDAYATQIATSEAAGREIVRQYRASLVGDEVELSAAAQRAVRAALAEEFERCASDYAAFPVESTLVGGPGDGLIAVYLVPLPTDDSVVPIGGFHRITYDTEAGRVVHKAAMTQNCLDLSMRPDGDRSGASVRSLLVTHDLTPYPLENHVFASMTSAVDLIVVSPGATWRVAQGDVRALD